MNAYLIDGIRTPIGNFGGTLAPVRTDDLAAHVLQALMQRHPDFDPVHIGDVTQCRHLFAEAKPVCHADANIGCGPYDARRPCQQRIDQRPDTERQQGPDHDPAEQHRARDAQATRGRAIIIAVVIVVSRTTVELGAPPTVFRMGEKMVSHIYTSSSIN